MFCVWQYGVAAIHLAAWFGSLEILKLLVQAGAEQKIENEVKMQQVLFYCFSDREKYPEIGPFFYLVQHLKKKKHQQHMPQEEALDKCSLSWILNLTFACSSHYKPQHRRYRSYCYTSFCFLMQLKLNSLTINSQCFLNHNLLLSTPGRTEHHALCCYQQPHWNCRVYY